MATKKTAVERVPVEVEQVPSGKPVPKALVDIKTSKTGNQKFSITIRPAKGRPILIAVHL